MWHCNNCNNKFEASMGGGMAFELYRCVDCGATKSIKRYHPAANPIRPKELSKEAVGKCEKCGGELKTGLRPMCPKCRSTDTKEAYGLYRYD